MHRASLQKVQGAAFGSGCRGALASELSRVTRNIGGRGSRKCASVLRVTQNTGGRGSRKCASVARLQCHTRAEGARAHPTSMRRASVQPFRSRPWEIRLGTAPARYRGAQRCRRASGLRSRRRAPGNGLRPAPPNSANHGRRRDFNRTRLAVAMSS